MLYFTIKQNIQVGIKNERTKLKKQTMLMLTAILVKRKTVW